MNRLFKFEFRKLFRQKSFYICGGIAVGLILLSAFTMNLLLSFSQNATVSADGVAVAVVADDTAFSGLYMLASALSGSDFSIILAVFVALFVCGDYNNGTLKNIIAKGYNRSSIYVSKYMVSLIASTMLACVCWLAGLLSGTAFWGIGELPADGSVCNFVIILQLQLLSIYAYTSLFFMISALLKKAGGAIAVGIIAPLVVVMIISMADAFINSETFSLSKYWLDNCYSDLAVTSLPSDTAVRCLVCFAIYIVVFTTAGHLAYRRHEV